DRLTHYRNLIRRKSVLDRFAAAGRGTVTPVDQIEKMTCGSHAIYNLIETGKALGGKIGGHRIKTSIIQIRTDVEFQGGRTEGQTVGSVQTGELLDNGAGYRLELC